MDKTYKTSIKKFLYLNDLFEILNNTLSEKPKEIDNNSSENSIFPQIKWNKYHKDKKNLLSFCLLV